MRFSSPFSRASLTCLVISSVSAWLIASGPAVLAAPQDRSAAGSVVSLTNAERAKAGCPALKAETRLTQAAQAHAEDMAARGRLDHNSSKGSPGDRIKAAGYQANTWAENIASGQSTPAAVVSAWMRSPGHRANILNCSLRDIGVGFAKSSKGTPYWTQDFGTSRGQGTNRSPRQ
ncbi:CAP domain-containing protein [Nocardia altamirensis]|uniref:CAP domain-containing protein n=1 Tax=Nocardia altamirensis TaxID=472158 RepID=UPI0009FE9EF2|nr:CAP domain-containing protein [Nocardia altamirensis]